MYSVVEIAALLASEDRSKRGASNPLEAMLTGLDGEAL
jgi:hypothetical protein